MDRHGVEQNVQASMAARDYIEEVANDGPCGRSNDANGSRKGRQGTLAVSVEKTLGFQALLELLESKLQRAHADRFHGFGYELELAALLVNADAAADQDVESVFRAEAKQHGLAAKEHYGQLRVCVFEREVNMAGGGGAVVGDFAFDPDVDIFLLDELADLADEFAYGPDAAGWPRRFKAEAELRQF